MGGFLSFFGGLFCVIVGSWGLWIELGIVHEAAGFWGIVIGLIIFPITLFAAPFYAIIANGDWFPLALIYGGGFVGTIIYGVSHSILENVQESIQKQECEREYLREGEDQ